MLRKSILTLAALATLGGAALAPNTAAAMYGGFGAFHSRFAPVAFHHRFVGPDRFVFRDRFVFGRPVFRPRVALLASPLVIDDDCAVVRRLWTPWAGGGTECGPAAE